MAASTSLTTDVHVCEDMGKLFRCDSSARGDSADRRPLLFVGRRTLLAALAVAACVGSAQASVVSTGNPVHNAAHGTSPVVASGAHQTVREVVQSNGERRQVIAYSFVRPPHDVRETSPQADATGAMPGPQTHTLMVGGSCLLALGLSSRRRKSRGSG